MYFNVTDAYGSRLLNLFRSRRYKTEFPLTLGVEFCGVVRNKGKHVRENIKIGDKVYGVSIPYRGGCHAEYVVVDQSSVSRFESVIEFFIFFTFLAKTQARNLNRQ